MAPLALAAFAVVALFAGCIFSIAAVLELQLIRPNGYGFHSVARRNRRHAWQALVFALVGAAAFGAAALAAFTL